MKKYFQPTLKFIDVDITEILAGSIEVDPNKEVDQRAKRQGLIIIDEEEDF